MISETGYLRIVKAGAWYDVISTGLLTTPWTFSFMLSTLAQIHAALGLPGAIPTYQPLFGVFGNLLGSVVLVWALLRIRSPEVRFGRYDAACRWLYTVWMTFALLSGFSPILSLYIIPEIALGVGQTLPLRSSETTPSAAPQIATGAQAASA